MPTVYLIHFDRPYKHARHYVGFTEADDVVERVAQHEAGNGARLLAVVAAAEIKFRVVRKWPGASRDFERRLKNARHTPRFCPECKHEWNEQRARRRRQRTKQ